MGLPNALLPLNFYFTLQRIYCDFTADELMVTISGEILALSSGSRCRFAYGPADATATHYLLLQ